MPRANPSSQPASTAPKSSWKPHLLERSWDMVIVDECHLLKNHRSANFRFVYRLRRKYCLLLSATPVQNELRELYNLVTLARPGHLRGFRTFKDRFMEDRRHARNVAYLRSLLSEVMVRSRRRDTLIELPPRHIHHHELPLPGGA